MRIAPHHVPGTPEHDLSKLLGRAPDYAPQCRWPEDCTVQWGDGIFPAVRFFEAFPRGTFIRGEGDDIDEAERDAFAQYERDVACDHVWGRQRPGGVLYTNGAAFCRKCGGFRSRMFPEIRPLGWWRKPLRAMEIWHLESLTRNPELKVVMDRKYPNDREKRRRASRVLAMRFSLFGSVKPTTDEE
jgi:hypothetical protein